VIKNKKKVKVLKKGGIGHANQWYDKKAVFGKWHRSAGGQHEQKCKWHGYARKHKVAMQILWPKF